MSKTATIEISVTLDGGNIPDKIEWKASDSGNVSRDCRAFLLSLWDPESKNSFGIDLWTNNMLVGDMEQLLFQTMLRLADTYEKSAANEENAAMIREFALKFGEKILPESSEGQSKKE